MQASNAPFISVVMCTYNGEKFIDEQVQSILQQTWQNMELIIVDDCSTDSTWQKLQQWQQQSTLVKLHRNAHNLGYNKNFEYAIQLAAGDLIALSDQDDIWLSEKLERLVPCFNDAQTVLAHSRSVRLENGKLDFHKVSLQHQFSGNDTRRLLFFNQMMGHDAMFRRSLVQHIVPIPERMSYDWWIAVVATCYGNIAAVPDFLVHHRIHGSNNFFSSGAASKKKELDLDETLRLFDTIPAMNERTHRHIHQLLQFLDVQNSSAHPPFNCGFFRFLLKNRQVIFGHKRRLLPIVSHVKNAMRYAKTSFRGKGISI
ncbi:glycosyltransferase [Deminuibacter soli]|nr:glycosyltransferase [Deminuibacter soli]